ncbi:tyrosine-type recombinase/integrase, partial [Candidatus Latescibacterota bacterium]
WRRMVKFKPVQIIKRGKSYQLYYYNPNGERRRITVGKDYQYAQRMSVKFSDWLLDGRCPEEEIERAKQIESSRQVTLSELYPNFMKRHGSLQSKKMQESYYHSYKNICRCPNLGDMRLDLISKSIVIDYMNARMKQDGVSAATVNKEASFIRGMLSRAVEWDMLDRNPLYGLRMLREAEKRDVMLTMEQASSLLAELPETISSIVEFAIYTGFRKRNILDLRIEQVRFHDITNTGEVDLVIKGGRNEVFPIGSIAIEVLKRAIRRRKEGYVFICPTTGTRYSTIQKSFDNAVRKLGLTVNDTKFRFHDLRHVFATWLHQKGVSLDTIRPLLGHSNRSTTDRYTTIDWVKCREVLDVIPPIKKASAI